MATTEHLVNEYPEGEESELLPAAPLLFAAYTIEPDPNATPVPAGDGHPEGYEPEWQPGTPL